MPATANRYVVASYLLGVEVSVVYENYRQRLSWPILLRQFVPDSGGMSSCWLDVILYKPLIGQLNYRLMGLCAK